MSNFLFLSTLSLRRATVVPVELITLVNISIHALLAESDPRLMYFWPCGLLFLSTLSLRRATVKIGIDFTDGVHFYPRSPCGERPIGPLIFKVQPHFYPRSPCGERLRHCTTYLNCSRFLSTLSLRRATGRHRRDDRCPIDFYPRSPCGERLTLIWDVIAVITISIHALLAESDAAPRFLLS